MTSQWITWDACGLCSGSGCVQVDYGLEQCPNCRLHMRSIERDRIRAAAEDSVETAWKDLRDEGVDELTLRYLAGDR